MAEGGGRAAVAEDRRVPKIGHFLEDRGVRRITTPTDQRVHRRQVGTDQARNRQLVRCCDIRSGKSEPVETTQGRFEPFRRNVEGDVDPVEAERRERRVLHARRERMRDRMSDQRDEPRPAADQCVP